MTRTANAFGGTDQSDATQVVYTLEPQQFGNLLSQLRAATPRFYLFDGLGSTDRLADNTGLMVTDTYLYDGFGNIRFSSGVTANAFRYVGRLGYYWDATPMFFYIRSRYYDPGLARWLSQDPLKALMHGTLRGQTPISRHIRDSVLLSIANLGPLIAEVSSIGV